MNTPITYTSRNTLVPWPALLAQQLDHWRSLTPIAEAEVVLQHKRTEARAFCVKVRLDVAGPALCTEVSDSTLEGALLLATRNLEHQIQARQTMSPLRLQPTRPMATLACRRTHAQADGGRHNRGGRR
jgi:hypothetical protein